MYFCEIQNLTELSDNKYSYNYIKDVVDSE